MARGGVEQDEAPIGEIVGRLIDQGKDYARAEVGLAKAIATAKADAFKLPALLLAAALLFIIGGVVTLCIAIAMALATVIGPLIGGIVASLVAFGIAAGLALIAKSKLSARS